MPEVERILTNLLRKICEDEGIKEPEYVIKDISTGGANFSSSLHLVTIKSTGRQDLELFAKVASISEELRAVMGAGDIFENELFVYQDLSKVYNQLQENSNIAEDERMLFPKFYACDSTHMEESIILENLAAKGYRLYDRLKSMTWEYAAAAVGELAKFHALSYAYREENPETFEKIVKERPSLFSGSNNILLQMFTISSKSTLQMFPKGIRDRLENFLSINFDPDTFLSFYKPNKHIVLAHGDYRVSNLMYKRKNGILDKLIPVDYQTIYCGSAITDLYYLIFSGTDGEFRRLHYKRLIEHYYNTFADFLKKLGHDSNKLYSRADFNEELKEKMPYGLIIGLCLMPGVLVDAEDAPKMDEATSLEYFTMKSNDLAKKRVQEIIDDFIKWGVL